MTAPTVAANPRGRFVWHDLMTTDTKGAIAFYSAIVGWDTQPWQGPSPYTMWTAKNVPLGGVMPLPPDAVKMGAPPHWLAYIAVPDVDESVREATSLGARVLAPAQDIPTVGRFAILADPQGAAYAVFKSLNAWPGHDGPAAVGEFAWHELVTKDWKTAFDFYHALFGWEKTSSMDMGAMGTYQMYGREGMSYGGMYNGAADGKMPPAWLHYIQVEDADKAAKQIPELGGKILNGPMDVPNGRVVMGIDPQGAAFAVHSSRAEA